MAIPEVGGMNLTSKEKYLKSLGIKVDEDFRWIHKDSGLNPDYEFYIHKDDKVSFREMILVKRKEGTKPVPYTEIKKKALEKDKKKK